ncbi:MAG TPA: fluoride efflux transporter CrcB [Bacillota bacterium]|nr:fluoride efflux transporter CrcB [Bacillota bacterium]
MNSVAVGLGGLFGAIFRYQIGKWAPIPMGIPLGTLFINLLGCFFLAWFFTITTNRWSINPNLRLGIGTGFTGAFTTFSTFSVETLNLINNNQFLIAFLYVVLSVVGGIGFAIIGAKLASIHFPPIRQPEGESK